MLSDGFHVARRRARTAAKEMLKILARKTSYENLSLGMIHAEILFSAMNLMCGEKKKQLESEGLFNNRCATSVLHGPEPEINNKETL